MFWLLSANVDCTLNDSLTHLHNSIGKHDWYAALQLLYNQCATANEEQQLTSKQQFQQCSLMEGESFQAFNNSFNKLLKNCTASHICVSHYTRLCAYFALCVTIQLCMLSSNSNPLKANLSKANLLLCSKFKATCKGMKKSSFPLSARYPLNNQSTRVLPHHLIKRRVVKKETTGVLEKEIGRHLPMQYPPRKRMAQMWNAGIAVNPTT